MRRHMGPTQAKGLDELCAELCGQCRLGTGSKDITQPQMCFSCRPSDGASSSTAWPCGSSCVPANLSSCCASAGYEPPNLL